MSVLLLAMLRPVSALIAAPFFSALQIPVQLRILIAVAIGLPANTMVHDALPTLQIVSIEGLLLVLSELAIGLIIGFT
ncbi:MAG: flagellar biosynthetic protein FliR, partial [Sphingopyxis sp.]